MLATAKVFTAGNSQAVRLPKAFRVDATEMWIARNEATGEITLKPKDESQRLQNLRKLLQMIRDDPLREDLVPPREMAEPRNPLAEWAEPPPVKRGRR